MFLFIMTVFFILAILGILKYFELVFKSLSNKTKRNSKWRNEQSKNLVKETELFRRQYENNFKSFEDSKLESGLKVANKVKDYSPDIFNQMIEMYKISGNINTIFGQLYKSRVLEIDDIFYLNSWLEKYIK